MTLDGRLERRHAAAAVFVDDVRSPVLGDSDRHHLGRVLRLREGQQVCVADGSGSWRSCRYRADGTLEPDGEVRFEPPRSPPLTVAFSPVKGDRPEWVVQKLTELGIDRIVPVYTTRSVVRWEGDRATTAAERLRRVAREAAAQSRQVRVPDVAAPMTLRELAAGYGPLVLAEPGGEPVTATSLPVVVGPEGGFTDEERATAGSFVGLPGGILRSETAAVALGVLLSAARDILPHP